MQGKQLQQRTPTGQLCTEQRVLFNEQYVTCETADVSEFTLWFAATPHSFWLWNGIRSIRPHQAARIGRPDRLARACGFAQKLTHSRSIARQVKLKLVAVESRNDMKCEVD